MREKFLSRDIDKEPCSLGVWFRWPNTISLKNPRLIESGELLDYQQWKIKHALHVPVIVLRGKLTIKTIENIKSTWEQGTLLVHCLQSAGTIVRLSRFMSEWSPRQGKDGKRETIIQKISLFSLIYQQILKASVHSRILRDGLLNPVEDPGQSFFFLSYFTFYPFSQSCRWNYIYQSCTSPFLSPRK
jgi:hypothetical protein